MNMLVVGMDLSYQWCPSLSHFQDRMIGKPESSPSMVEHPGEVILRAIRMAGYIPDSRTGLIYNPGLLDISDYKARISSFSTQVEFIDETDPSLVKNLAVADQLLHNDGYQQIVICRLAGSGSASIVLRHPAAQNEYLARIQSNTIDEPPADYLILSDGLNDPRTDLEGYLARHPGQKQPLKVGWNIPINHVPGDVIEIFQLIESVSLGYLPAGNDQNDHGLEDNLPDNVYELLEHQPWLYRDQGFRRTAVLLHAGEGLPDSLTATEPEDKRDPTPIRLSSPDNPQLILIGGADQTELKTKLEDLSGSLTNSHKLAEINQMYYQQFRKQKNEYTICLIAKSHQDLRREIQFALEGVESAFSNNTIWSSPQGSYFTPDPLTGSKVAFVYPGAFNSYPRMGSDLFYSFPQLEIKSRDTITNLSHSLAEPHLFPLSPSKSRAEREMDFLKHPDRLIESGISLSVLYTILFDDVFKLQPDLALGYSLGEISMLWANQIWTNGDELSQTWNCSQLFRDQLSGPMELVREYWHDLELPENFWKSYILKVDAELAKQACDQEQLAFLSIINTQDEVVIAGEESACQRVIEQLGCRSLPMPFSAAIHSPPVSSAYQEFSSLYNNPTYKRQDIEFYSAAHYGVLDLERDQVAESMASMTCNHLDFPRLVDKVYDGGARIFIEIGPQKTCSRWIGRILEGKPHAVIPVNKKGQADYLGILKVVALLVSHGIPIRLDPLFVREPIRETRPTHSDREINDLHNNDTGQTKIQTPAKSSTKLEDVYLAELDRISALTAASHERYLAVEASLSRNLAQVVSMQSDNLRSLSLQGLNDIAFTRDQIEAFTIGDHRVCFGDLYEGFGDRRIPRLPNGNLLFLDRVVRIADKNGSQARPSLTGEFDHQLDAWYQQGTNGSLPLVSLLEISLQPCGFLSAARGTIRGREDQDLYFRNLDGEVQLTSWPEDQTGPIKSQVKLLSSNSLDDVIIQNYEFRLSWGGEDFLTGSSSFGYFPQEMLIDQTGLNKASEDSPWIERDPSKGGWINQDQDDKSDRQVTIARLPVIDRLWVADEAGNYSSGYIYTEQTIDSRSWFFKNHFHQDPVMPGSLGIETMGQALAAGATSLRDLPSDLKWRLKENEQVTWKYRGQITPDVDSFQIRLHVKEINKEDDRWIITADGELWRGSTHIYQVHNLCLESYR